MLPDVQLIETPSGRYLSLVTDFGVSVNLREDGHYAAHLSDAAIKLIERFTPAGTLVDIGAHIGTFSIPVAKATGCAVMAFEAQRIISQLLGANLVINGIASGVVEHCVLGSPGHPKTMAAPVVDYTQPGNFGAYSTDVDRFAAHSLRKLRVREKTEHVRVSTLDAYQLTDVALIKLDVEGAERAVLQGATETLERSGYPPIIFEAWQKEDWQEERLALNAFLESLGYAVVSLGDDHVAQHRSMANPVSF